MEGMKKVLGTWLFHQCRILSGSTQALLLTGPPGEGPYDLALFWLDKDRDHSALLRVARAALHHKQAVIKTRNNKAEKTGELLDALACPLLLNDQLFGSETVGALLLQRAADKPFTAETVEQCEQIGLLLGPVDQHHNRSADTRVIYRGRTQLFPRRGGHGKPF